MGISRGGEEWLRALLYEAATVILTRGRSASALRSFAQGPGRCPTPETLTESIATKAAIRELRHHRKSL
jgi:hypothetical protein